MGTRGGFVVLCALGLGAALAAPAVAQAADPAASAAPASTPVASPATVVVGERFTLTGNAPAPARRLVLLQRRTERSWTTVATTRTDAKRRYSFVRRAAAQGARLRVVAPATAGKPRWVSSVRGVPTVTDRARLSLAGDVTGTVALAHLRPVRPGRTARLRVFRNGAWRPLGPAVAADAQGVVRWQLPQVSLAAHPYRVLVSQWNGAPGFASASVSFAPQAVPRTLPKLALTTAGGAPVVSKETYLPGTLSVNGAEPVVVEIRGRGNFTWTQPKKPYRLKLGASASLLGLPADRDWALLANYSDRSALRTRLAFALAEATGLGWTPKSVMVDVSLNGVEIGLYQLTEHVEAKTGKAELADGGLMLENDQRMESDGTPGIRTSRGTPLAFKDPDDPTTDQVVALTEDVEAFEDALFGADWLDPVLGYAPYVDRASFVDWYLINEFTKNFDADGTSSMFLTWDPAGNGGGGAFAMSNVWDFDHSSGFAPWPGHEYGDPTGWWLRGGPGTPDGRPYRDTAWLTRMTADPAFRDALAARWALLRPAFAAAVDDLDEQASSLRASTAMDWAIWRVDNLPVGGSVHGTHAGAEASYLQTWLSARLAWFDTQFVS